MLMSFIVEITFFVNSSLLSNCGYDILNFLNYVQDRTSRRPLNNIYSRVRQELLYFLALMNSAIVLLIVIVVAIIKLHDWHNHFRQQPDIVTGLKLSSNYSEGQQPIGHTHQPAHYTSTFALAYISNNITFFRSPCFSIIRYI